MDIKRIFTITNQLRYLKSIIHIYGDSLKKGKYFMFGGYRALSYNSDDVLGRAAAYFEKSRKSGKLATLVSKINKTSYFYNSNKNSSEEYEAIYTANNYEKIREVKLFSFSKNKILTVCTSEQEMKKQLEQNQKFGWAYNMPRVTKCDKYAKSYEIDMVEIKPFPDESLALGEIIQSTMKFNTTADLLSAATVKKLIQFDYPNDEINSLLYRLASRIDKCVLELEIPLSIQHGDLSKENLMYGAVEDRACFWWIDWEHARERVFFYDYFFYIVNSLMYYDDKAFRYYMSEESNSALEEFFKHFGLVFELLKKKDYLLVFAIVFLKERVCEFGRIAALKEYCSLIEEKLF